LYLRVFTVLIKDSITITQYFKFMDAVSAVDQMGSSERELGICINGEHHAYSLNLLCRHEVVTFELIPETGSIFSRVVDGRTLTFLESGVNTFSTILI